jgi:hypothetical protein
MPEYHLTSLPIDCCGLSNVRLSFWRWLGVAACYGWYWGFGDHAYVRISNDGANWTTVWESYYDIHDDSWVYQELDISAAAADQPHVYLRWTMGSTDSIHAGCGWNIDDIEVSAVGTHPIAGDLDGDGCVDQTDLGILLADWGCTGGDCPGDCDDDGDTDQADLGILLAHWGEGCP